jgi:iron complex transport system substrate-binding protein
MQTLSTDGARTLVILLGSVALVSAAVDHWANPTLSPTLARHGYGQSHVQLGPKAYPREVVDSDGFHVRIEKPPRRIASQYWSIDEYLYSIVPPERVVAVSESAYLQGISNVLEAVNKYKPVIAADPEKVLRANPDLIIVSSGGRSDYTSLVRSSGIPLYRMFIDFTTLEQVEDYIRLIGYLTGEDDRADEVAARFHADIQRARSLKPANARTPRVMGLGGQYSYGSHTLFDDIIKTLGAVNPSAQAGLKGYDMINGEQLARWNPDWIIAGGNGSLDATRKRILADPGVALTEAGRRGQVLVMPNNLFLPMSPYAITRVNRIAEAIWK